MIKSTDTQECKLEEPNDFESYKSDCEFCKELIGERSSFANIYRDVMNNRIIFSGDNFSIIPTIGQIVRGYLLLISNRHKTSIGSLRYNEMQELEKLMSSIERAFLKVYGKKTIFFEHGIPCDNNERGGCGISHLHLHALPLDDDIDLLDEVSKDFNLKRIKQLDELRDIIFNDKAYILYVNKNKDKFVAEVDKIPSQYMRFLLAKKIKHDEWDWRACDYEEKLIITYHDLIDIISKDKLA